MPPELIIFAYCMGTGVKPQTLAAIVSDMLETHNTPDVCLLAIASFLPEHIKNKVIVAKHVLNAVFNIKDRDQLPFDPSMN